MFIKLTCDHADLKLFGYIYIFLVRFLSLRIWILKLQSGQIVTVNINPENLQTADNK